MEEGALMVISCPLENGEKAVLRVTPQKLSEFVTTCKNMGARARSMQQALDNGTRLERAGTVQAVGVACRPGSRFQRMP
jgi:hypothetical protein